MRLSFLVKFKDKILDFTVVNQLKFGRLEYSVYATQADRNFPNKPPKIVKYWLQIDVDRSYYYREGPKFHDLDSKNNCGSHIEAT